MFAGLALISALEQQAPLVQPMPVPEPPNIKPAAVEKLSPSTYKVGSLIIDIAKREVSVPGVVNDVVTLEFVANTKGGYKAYESALTLDTNGVNFNVAMLLIGLDVRRGRAAARQFDPTPPEGDPVEVLVEWTANGRPQRVRVERLLYDQRTQTTLPEGPWVYTGSTFVETGEGRKYLADLDGVLIGFMHGPQAIIDNPRNHAVDGFGSLKLNPAIGLPPGTAVTLTVRALPLVGK